MPRLEQRVYALNNRTIEEVIELVRFILSYDGDVSKILIRKGSVLAEYVVQDEGPPFGKLPEVPFESLAEAIPRINLEPLKALESVDTGSVSSIASAMIQARKAMQSPIAWVVYDTKVFSRWVGVGDDITRLFDLPVYELSETIVPTDKVILLCGKTISTSPLRSNFGIVIEMSVA
jgi:hypothetical protein